MKTVTLHELLTPSQIAHAARLYKALGMEAVPMIQSQVIEPNMAAINAKLGQENDARYITYAVVYVFSEEEES